MNLTEVGMDKFCTFHQQPHSKKNCPQWISLMTLVMNQLLDSKLTENTEEEKDLRYEDILETNVTTRSQALIKENSLMLPKIKKLQKNVKKFQKSTSANKILEFTTTSQNPRQINMPTKPIEEKINNVKTNLTEHNMDYDIVEDIHKGGKIYRYLRCAMCRNRKKSY